MVGGVTTVLTRDFRVLLLIASGELNAKQSVRSRAVFVHVRTGSRSVAVTKREHLPRNHTI